MPKSVAEPAGQAQANPGTPDLETQWGELLAAVQDVLSEFDPQLGALGDLPQITVDPADVARVCLLAKDDPRMGFPQLLCLSCVDYLDHLEMVYFLHSLSPEKTLCVKTRVPCDDPRLPSVTDVWRAAEWYEREAHDLFGVVFDGHPDLSPLLLYEEFEGYPGRKEFPFHDYKEY